MDYFVTGATGFVGSWVVERLVERGAHVTCLVRKTSNLRWISHLPLTYVYGSLFEPETYREALSKCHYVLHIAGVTKALKKKDYYLHNVEATDRLLQATVEWNQGLQKFVHISSQAAVGPSPSQEGIDETHPCHPLTDYGKSKLRSEELASAYMDRLPITVLRPPAVYGPRDRDVFEVFRNIHRGFNLKVGRQEQFVSVIFVKDLAEGILLAAEHPASAGQIFFISDDSAYRWSEITDRIKQIQGVPARDVTIPVPLALTAAAILEGWFRLSKKPGILNIQKIKEIRQPFWVVSNRKIKEQLGYRQNTSLERGLQVTYQWYVQNGWLSAS